MRFLSLRAAVAAAALALIAPAAQAGIIGNLNSVTPEPGGFRFSYDVFFDGSNFGGGNTITLESGDFFTIYDFAGLVPATNLQPPNWTFSTALTGKQPVGVSTVIDDPLVPNLSWTYIGASQLA